MERDLESKVNQILSTTFGKGNAVARVTAEIDFNKRELTREEYDDTPILRSQQSMEINSTNRPDGPQAYRVFSQTLPNRISQVKAIIRNITNPKRLRTSK